MKKRRESYCQRERGERREDTCLLGFCLGTDAARQQGPQPCGGCLAAGREQGGVSHTLQYFRAWHGRLGHWGPSAAKLRLFFEKLRRLAEPGAKATELVTLPMLEDSGESPALSASSPEVPGGLSILCSSARAASASNLVAQRASLDCTTVPSSRSAEACRTASTQRCGEWMRCQPSALWCCGTAWRLLKASVARAVRWL